MSAGKGEFVHLPTPMALAEEATGRIVEIARAAVADHGYFAWALSGGNTPVATYRLLGQSPWRERVDWTRTHIFFADERFVPHDHADSNYRSAEENLLRHVLIPPENVHAAPITSPEPSAAVYQQDILAFFAPHPPRFDLVTLGMGPDGHTASLFPGMDDLGDTLVAAVRNSPKPPPLRLTMTYGLLNQALNVIFLVTGADKATLLAEIAGDADTVLPAGKIATAGRPAVWLVSLDS